MKQVIFSSALLHICMRVFNLKHDTNENAFAYTSIIFHTTGELIHVVRFEYGFGTGAIQRN